jgi:hypothetical protein
MPRSARENQSLTKRRLLVSDLYVQCWPQMSIAQKLGIAQSTVNAGLKAIRKTSHESQVHDFAEALTWRALSQPDRDAAIKDVTLALDKIRAVSCPTTRKADGQITSVPLSKKVLH